MPSSDNTPGLAAISQAFGLTIEDPAVPKKVNGDAKVSDGTNGVKSHERYVYAVFSDIHTQSLQLLP
jgi:hypothetical protein